MSYGSRRHAAMLKQKDERTRARVWKKSISLGNEKQIRAGS